MSNSFSVNYQPSNANQCTDKYNLECHQGPQSAEAQDASNRMDNGINANNVNVKCIHISQVILHNVYAYWPLQRQQPRKYTSAIQSKDSKDVIRTSTTQTSPHLKLLDHLRIPTKCYAIRKLKIKITQILRSD
jgi:hypothetical protein